jgi:hypothetical protein
MMLSVRRCAREVMEITSPAFTKPTWTHSSWSAARMSSGR